MDKKLIQLQMTELAKTLGSMIDSFQAIRKQVITLVGDMKKESDLNEIKPVLLTAKVIEEEMLCTDKFYHDSAINDSMIFKDEIQAHRIRAINQLFNIAEEYNKRALKLPNITPKITTFYTPIWNKTDQTIGCISDVHTVSPVFIDKDMLFEAYYYNKEIFKTALC